MTEIHAGSADNIVPESGWFGATIRSFTPEVRKMVETRIREILEGHAASFGVTVDIDYELGYPPTINTADEVSKAVSAAREISGEERVADDQGREMGAEDFAYMLEKRPGAYLFLGQGEGPGLHHPKFDFNDEVAAFGSSFFARLIERLNPIV